MASIRVVFASVSPTKVLARTFPNTKAEERIKKKKARKGLILYPDSQPQKKPNEEGFGLPVSGLMTPGRQMLGGSAQGLILQGWWQHR